MPIDPSFMAQGAEWGVGGVGGVGPQQGLQGPGQAAPEGEGFGGVLGTQLDKLSQIQGEGAQASQQLADGSATDVSSVVMAVERARLSMQLASQVRNKAVEAYQDIFHTQV
jgi:flagellar hook-basal body complex protein FliE